jgi:hypothetical protein
MTRTVFVEWDNAIATSHAWVGFTQATPVSLLNEGLVSAGRTMPTVIPEDEAFFWTPRWQAGEHASEEDYRAGRFRQFDSVDDAIRALLGDD